MYKNWNLLINLHAQKNDSFHFIRWRDIRKNDTNKTFRRAKIIHHEFLELQNTLFKRFF